jgi:hypothetical protein
MVRTVRRGKSGLHRVGWRLITARREARNRATETSLAGPRSCKNGFEQHARTHTGGLARVKRATSTRSNTK